jgi:hypothetical protein
MYGESRCHIVLHDQANHGCTIIEKLRPRGVFSSENLMRVKVMPPFQKTA